MLKFIYFLIAFLTFVESKEEINSEKFYLNSDIFVLYNYLIKLNLLDVVKDYELSIKQIFLYIFFLKGFIEQKFIKRLIEYKYLLLSDQIENEEVKKNIKEINFFLNTHINYKYYEEYIKISKEFIKKNLYIQYNICILNTKISQEEVNKTSMKELIKKYCILKFLSNGKKRILFYCPQCNKNEIRSHLLKMSIKEKQIVYLKEKNRYVILERLDDDNKLEDEISEDNFKYLYIKYGLSLYIDNKKLFKAEVEKLLHKLICG
jgi:hypothetical protein